MTNTWSSTAAGDSPSHAVRSYRQLAAYNAWANARLYAAAAELGAEACAKPMGAFFGSILGTLNHLVVTDRIWLARLLATGAPQPPLDTLLETDLARLLPLRVAEDARLTAFVAALDAARLVAPLTYANSSGQSFSQSCASALDHVFNHQTHHRGQAHTLLAQLGGRAAAPSLDLIVFQREQPRA
ncbi:DinB family protein [Xanthobacter agilis]|uniref:Damage-inducible protein DinB n=1 Tax=Xanthobacter agilis TaxID=47492 RepID=A0ABU0LFJ2_XANAG|nr:DinB family protein [Xanthobacter agilis]MDQ0505910.1 putative damage-inducible protein DinB [Xanthobacter agilis]